MHAASCGSGIEADPSIDRHLVSFPACRSLPALAAHRRHREDQAWFHLCSRAISRSPAGRVVSRSTSPPQKAGALYTDQ
ncbi:hypothetical protein U9M48_034313 [Paspalum notatum var. saurae]|uniref:Uncharacterized protein n=1 Tax=Paspalum notatum var. saurae TaxID=547442 RepID=A0AAQ3X6P3_PASNO